MFHFIYLPRITGLEKSAAIWPFATKKSRLASETFLLADSLATESCRLAYRLATNLFSKKGEQRRCGLNVIAQGAWRGLCWSKMQGSWPFGPRRSCLRVNFYPRGLGAFPARFSFRDHLSLVGRRKYRMRCDCQFARHISHPHESFSVRV